MRNWIKCFESFKYRKVEFLEILGKVYRECFKFGFEERGVIVLGILGRGWYSYRRCDFRW